MQIKYGFKKEWLLSLRTFRLFGILITMFSFSLADPLMYKLLGMMMGELSLMDSMGDPSLDEAMAEMAELSVFFNDAGLVFSVSLSEFCLTGLIIIMLILMAPAGGEQKKRSTIIPACSGLKFFDYLVPKFVMYPAIVFVTTFAAAMTAGGLCNILFTENIIPIGLMLLESFMCATFILFIVSIYFCVGLCTSRPGIATIFIYLGMNLVDLILTNLQLTKFHPFALRSLITTGEMTYDDFSLADNAASIAVGIALSFVIAAVMFFLTNSVLSAKKIDNQEDKPEF